MHRLNRSALRLLAFLMLATMPVTGIIATHNMAGEIRAERIGVRTYKITLLTYTDPEAACVDRCNATLFVCSPSGAIIDSLPNIPRSNGLSTIAGPPGCGVMSCGGTANMGEYIYGFIKENIYYTNYTFPNDGKYFLRYYDRNRINDVVNMTNSGNQSLFVETQLLVSEAFLQDNPPILLNRPLDFACTGKIWTHNPGAYDPDGDSLMYDLYPSQQWDPAGGMVNPVTCAGWVSPGVVGGTSSITIDPFTGLITWNAPIAIGTYNIAIRIRQFRKGVEIGYVIRDMAIIVKSCNNDPPVIETINDTCVHAGDVLDLDFTVYDPNFPTDSLYFYLNNGATGINNGPFSAVPPATISTNFGTSFPIATKDTILGNINWNTTCDHIRSAFYQIDMYAHDNLSYHGMPGNEMLSTHHVIKIRVVAPPLTNLTGTKGPHRIDLNWDQHLCSNAEGYTIWRKIGSGSTSLDTICCDLSPQFAGYAIVGTTIGWTSTSFTDTLAGVTFSGPVEICYVVTASFDNGAISSCPTNEVCFNIEPGVLHMTNDSIVITDALTGSSFIAWSTPDSIDNLFFPGPYTYQLSRAFGITGTTYSTIVTGLSFTDTTFTDLNINTVTQGYRHVAEVYDALGWKIAEAPISSSVYLTTLGGDKEITLSWSEYVPWQNTLYYIYRSSSGFVGPYLLHDSVSGTGATLHTYRDSGLVNGQEYCYFIRSKGNYPFGGVKSLLINDSQKRCDIAEDRTPPCVSDSIIVAYSCEALTVSFTITKPDSLCGGDAMKYTFYFSPAQGGPFLPVRTIDLSTFTGDTVIVFQDLLTIAGCYYITATDSNNNESAPSRTWCFDNCPILDLGNVVTPNGDGINDEFVPISYRSVRLIRFTVLDRWGVVQKINTTDLLRLWDGTNQNGKPASEGVYYYVMEYEELRLDGNKTLRKSGNITLLR